MGQSRAKNSGHSNGRAAAADDNLLLCCSKHSLESSWIDSELSAALQHGKMAVIPLNLDGFLFKWKSKHSDALRQRLTADFVGWKNGSVFERGFERLMKVLQADDADQLQERNP